MQRTYYACTMLRWLGYAATERCQRNLATGETCWQVTAEGGGHVIVARADSRAAAWFEACRLGEWLEGQD